MEHQVHVVGNTSFHAKVIDLKIHLLDLNKGMTITNAMCERFQWEVLESLGIQLIQPFIFNWVLYHTDGVCSLFENGRFKACPLGLTDPDFFREMIRLYGGVGGRHPK